MNLDEALTIVDNDEPERRAEALAHLHRTKATLFLHGSYARRVREAIKAGVIEEDV